MKLSAILIKTAVVLAVIAAICVAAVSCGNKDIKEQNVKIAYYDEASGLTFNLYDVVKKVYDGQNEVMAEYKYAGAASYTGDATRVVIPEKIVYEGNEYPVTLVEAMAFSNVDGSKSEIESVTLPESVTVIFDGAFEANRSLKKVEMPGVTTISASAFKDCTSLKYGGFTLPDTIESIEARAFSGAFIRSESELEEGTGFCSIKLPDSLRKLGSDVFTDCDAIKDIEIGKTLASIGSKAFYGCTNISSVTVSDENQAFASSDGVIYSKDMTTLIFYSPAKPSTTFEIPSSVKTLESAAMQSLKYLEKVTIPAGITAIPDSFFAYSASLKEIGGGDDVRSVGGLSFAGCLSLEKIEFIGRLTSLSQRAFTDCQSLVLIEINPAIGEIPDGCFSGCARVESIVLPSNLKTIGISAFSGCSSLAAIDIPETVTSVGTSAFSYCLALERVTVPSSITEIPPSCFYSDTKLVSVVLPSAVKSIGDSAFKSCGSLKSVEFASSSTSVAANAFAYCASLEYLSSPLYASSPLKITYVGDSAFSGCESLKTVNLSSASYIGQLAFSGCKSLTSLMIPVNPGSYSFRDCTSLQKVVIGDAVTAISDSTFSGCTALSDVTFGASLSKIGEKAFAGCTSLESFTVIGSNGTFKSSNGVLFTDGGKTLSFYPCGKKDAEYTVPAGTTDIADGAFTGAAFLQRVVLSSDTVNMGSEAFSGCTALTGIDFGGVTAISKKAFLDCTALREVDITSEKITKIGYGAFSGCTGLEKVTVGNNVTVMNTAATVDTISFAFVGCDFEKLTFYTPAGSYFESQLLRIGGLKIVNY